MRRGLIQALLVVGPTLLAVSCADNSLPEPESEAARLYATYCTQGCHDPIPPQQSSVGYWNNQYQRWLTHLRKEGLPAPDAREDSLIQDYLRRHARGSRY
jgi:hypothetical protein